MKLQLYSAADVRRALPMAEAIGGVKAGYVQLSAGRAQVPLRVPLNVSPDDVTLIMPFFTPDGGGALGLKLVSVFGSNIPRGLPSSTPSSWPLTRPPARLRRSSRAAA